MYFHILVRIFIGSISLKRNLPKMLNVQTLWLSNLGYLYYKISDICIQGCFYSIAYIGQGEEL